MILTTEQMYALMATDDELCHSNIRLVEKATIEALIADAARVTTAHEAACAATPHSEPWREKHSRIADGMEIAIGWLRGKLTP